MATPKVTDVPQKSLLVESCILQALKEAHILLLQSLVHLLVSICKDSMISSPLLAGGPRCLKLCSLTTG